MVTLGTQCPPLYNEGDNTRTPMEQGSQPQRESQGAQERRWGAASQRREMGTEKAQDSRGGEGRGVFSC